jgi:uncharacterized cupin superfamily protein
MTKPARRHANVANVAEIDGRSFTKGDRFALTSRPLGRATGGKGIGCSWYEVPPGRTAFPNHWHAVNEEAVYILEGTGTLRIGTDEVPVGPGDYASFPTGPQSTHQLLNTGSGPLRYLCLSTGTPSDVCGYPDSKKIGAFGYAPDNTPWVRMMSREGSSLDYYDGEVDPGS